MRVIGDKDILGAVTLEEVVGAVEKALVLYEGGDFLMPQRMHADYRGNTLLAMPCFAGRRFATKLVSLFPGNKEHGEAVLMGTVILNDGATGRPLALLNGATLTALRTGAVGGLGVRCLAPAETRACGVIGAGVQGFYQALFACGQRPITDLWVYDVQGERAASLIERLGERLPGVTLHRAKSTAELTAAAQLVITATDAREPVLPDDEGLLRGKCVVGIGSYKRAMREFPRALFTCLERVFVDTDHAVEEAGDLIIPLERGWLRRDRVVTLGKLLTGAEEPPPGEETTRLFKSVGMALFDLLTADLVYEKAVQKGLGTEVEL